MTTTLKALADYFNAKDAPNHKPLKDFAAELKELSSGEKLEMGRLAAEAMGQTIG